MRNGHIVLNIDGVPVSQWASSRLLLCALATSRDQRNAGHDHQCECNGCGSPKDVRAGVGEVTICQVTLALRNIELSGNGAVRPFVCSLRARAQNGRGAP